MDSLTHIVLGAAIGELTLGKKIGKKAMLWGALADTIPDFDVFASPFISQVDSLLVHRGITHSILFMLVASPLLGKLFAAFKFKRQTSWENWTLLFLLGMGTHVLIDSFTAYGTGWFEPFSSYRVSFHTIFVADFIYTLPLLISSIALLILKTNSPKRRSWALWSIYLSSTYLVFTFINKVNITSKTQLALEEQHISYSRVLTTPTPLNNILWMAVAEQPDGFKIGYYSLLDKNKTITFATVKKQDSLISKMQNDKGLKTLKQFSNNYYCITKTDSNLYFNDIRFGQLGGWQDSLAPFAFSYKLDKNGDEEQALNRGRLKGSFGKNLAELWQRIKGI
jgi:inner membrane protein